MKDQTLSIHRKFDHGPSVPPHPIISIISHLRIHHPHMSSWASSTCSNKVSNYSTMTVGARNPDQPNDCRPKQGNRPDTCQQLGRGLRCRQAIDGQGAKFCFPAREHRAACKASGRTWAGHKSAFHHDAKCVEN